MRQPAERRPAACATAAGRRRRRRLPAPSRPGRGGSSVPGAVATLVLPGNRRPGSVRGVASAAGRRSPVRSDGVGTAARRAAALTQHPIPASSGGRPRRAGPGGAGVVPRPEGAGGPPTSGPASSGRTATHWLRAARPLSDDADLGGSAGVAGRSPGLTRGPYAPDRTAGAGAGRGGRGACTLDRGGTSRCSR